jgi:hypothetical protein
MGWLTGGGLRKRIFGFLYFFCINTEIDSRPRKIARDFKKILENS